MGTEYPRKKCPGNKYILSGGGGGGGGGDSVKG